MSESRELLFHHLVGSVFFAPVDDSILGGHRLDFGRQMFARISDISTWLCH